MERLISEKAYKKFYGKISPSPLIYIRGNGEKLPNHNLYRKDTLSKLDSSCQLYHEFINDSKWLYYKELFGIALNLINVETGAKAFKKVNCKFQNISHINVIGISICNI